MLIDNPWLGGCVLLLRLVGVNLKLGDAQRNVTVALHQLGHIIIFPQRPQPPTTFMTSLPAEAPPNVQGLTDVVEAYGICLQLQSALQRAINIGKNIGNDMIYIRILGYLIHYPATDEQLRMVSRQIISANDNISLLQIGQSYFSHYIRACAFTTLPLCTI